MPSVPPPNRRFSTRALVLVGAAVLVVALVIGLVVGLSGDDDSPKPAAADLPTTSAAPTTAAPAPASSASASTSAAIGGAPPLAADVCTTLGNTAPVTGYVTSPRPVGRMPASYVEPSVGVRVAVCAGFFRPGGGAGRGRIAYLAEYEQLPATRYALTLKTRGWLLVPSLPRTTYRDSANTTVTLVQHGTSLITVVGTGG